MLTRSISAPPDATCLNNYLLFVLYVCGTSGEYLLFCKGADSSIFPRVVSGKVEQVKARVEQNAVVSVQFKCSLIVNPRLIGEILNGNMFMLNLKQQINTTIKHYFCVNNSLITM